MKRKKSLYFHLIFTVFCGTLSFSEWLGSHTLLSTESWVLSPIREKDKVAFALRGANCQILMRNYM